MFRLGISCLALCAGLITTANILQHFHVYILGSCLTSFGAFYLLSTLSCFCVGLVLTLIASIRWRAHPALTLTLTLTLVLYSH